jgi:hypothetical protein
MKRCDRFRRYKTESPLTSILGFASRYYFTTVYVFKLLAEIMPVVVDKCSNHIQFLISFGVHEGSDRTSPEFLPHVVSRLLGGFLAIANIICTGFLRGANRSGN